MDPCRSVGDGGGDASRRYLYTPVSSMQADNECRLEGDKTHEIFHFLSKKVGGDISYVVPTKLKSGGDASPPSPTDLRPCNIHKLEMVQRRSARHIMHNYTRHASVTTMLQHLDLPTLQQRRQHSKIIMLYRIRHQLASIPTATYIRPSTRNTQHYILPYARTLVFQTSFFPSTIKIWNNLQPVITNSTTIPRLRKALQSTPTSGRRGATLSA